VDALPASLSQLRFSATTAAAANKDSNVSIILVEEDAAAAALTTVPIISNSSVLDSEKTRQEQQQHLGTRQLGLTAAFRRASSDLSTATATREEFTTVEKSQRQQLQQQRSRLAAVAAASTTATTATTPALDVSIASDKKKQREHKEHKEHKEQKEQCTAAPALAEESVSAEEERRRQAELRAEELKYNRFQQWLRANGAYFPYLTLRRYRSDYRGVHVATPSDAELAASEAEQRRQTQKHKESIVEEEKQQAEQQQQQQQEQQAKRDDQSTSSSPSYLAAAAASVMAEKKQRHEEFAGSNRRLALKQFCDGLSTLQYFDSSSSSAVKNRPHSAVFPPEATETARSAEDGSSSSMSTSSVGSGSDYHVSSRAHERHGASVKAGSIVLRVPLKLLVTTELARASPIGQLISRNTELGAQTVMAMYILQERLKGDKSFWQPWLACLPQRFDSLPMFFSASELACLQGCDDLLLKIQCQQKSMLEAYNIIMELQGIDKFVPFSYEDFLWACTSVGTRVFSLCINNAKTSVLAPLADMMNHSEQSGTTWAFDSQLESFTLTSHTTFFHGDAVYESYGPKCNKRFFASYGFCLEDNPSNEVSIFVRPGGMGSNAPLRRFVLRAACDVYLGRVLSFLRLAHAQTYQLKELGKRMDVDFKRRCRSLHHPNAAVRAQMKQQCLRRMQARLSSESAAAAAAYGRQAAAAVMPGGYEETHGGGAAAADAAQDGKKRFASKSAAAAATEASVTAAAEMHAAALANQQAAAAANANINSNDDGMQYYSGNVFLLEPDESDLPCLACMCCCNIGPLSVDNELSVLYDLRNACREHLRSYTCSLQDDLHLLQSDAINRPESNNIRNILLFRSGEKKICHFFIRWCNAIISLLCAPWSHSRQVIQKMFFDPTEADYYYNVTFAPYLSNVVIPLLQQSHHANLIRKGQRYGTKSTATAASAGAASSAAVASAVAAAAAADAADGLGGATAADFDDEDPMSRMSSAAYSSSSSAEDAAAAAARAEEEDEEHLRREQDEEHLFREQSEYDVDEEEDDADRAVDAEADEDDIDAPAAA
jgi:hypothetical protein